MGELWTDRQGERGGWEQEEKKREEDGGTVGGKESVKERNGIGKRKREKMGVGREKERRGMEELYSI